MRRIFGVLFAVFVVSELSVAFECRQNEAQFFGVVSEARTDRIDSGIWDCYIRIQFTEFKPSQVCPMDEMEASRSDIFVASDRCENLFNVGDEISGYLVEAPSGRFYLER